MKIEEHEIDKDCFLRDWLKNQFSKRRITSLKRNGGMTIDGKTIRADERVYVGQVIRLEFTEEKVKDFIPVDLGLKVVYEDEDITVIKKGKGITPMPTVRHPKNSILNGMKYLFPNNTYRVMTRLDKDTEGLVLLANNALTQSRTFSINKYYVAVVEGRIEKEITVDLPIDRGFGIERVIGGDKQCISIIKPIWTGKNYTFVMMQPITGRTHQLRLHTAHIGHSIVGDTVYGSAKGEYNSGQMLACVKLEITHPTTQKIISVSLDDLYNDYFEFAKNIDNQ